MSNHQLARFDLLLDVLENPDLLLVPPPPPPPSLSDPLLQDFLNTGRLPSTSSTDSLSEDLLEDLVMYAKARVFHRTMQEHIDSTRETARRELQALEEGDLEVLLEKRKRRKAFDSETEESSEEEENSQESEEVD